jgi:hypothetical protein
MTPIDLIDRLRATALDKDNCPRMDCERWCWVGLAKEAADEIERLRTLEPAKDAIPMLAPPDAALMERVVNFIDERDPFGEVFSQHDLERLGLYSPESGSTISLTDDDLYRLFIVLDNVARYYEGRNEGANALRQKLLPVYRDWHAANPHKVHPSSQSSGQRDPNSMDELERQGYFDDAGGHD